MVKRIVLFLSAYAFSFLLILLPVYAGEYSDENTTDLAGGYMPLDWDRHVNMTDQDISFDEALEGIVKTDEFDNGQGILKSSGISDYSQRADLPTKFPNEGYDGVSDYSAYPPCVSIDVSEDVLVISGKNGETEEPPSYPYTSKKIVPRRNSYIVYNGVVYSYGTDYSIKFKRNKNRGEAIATIKWAKTSDPYFGGLKKTNAYFRIVSRKVSYLGNKSNRVYSGESTETKILVEFVGLIIRNRIYTKLKEETRKAGSKANYMTVPAAIRELEKLELIKTPDGSYRLNYAVTATQKAILKAFDMDVGNIKEQARKIGLELDGKEA